MSSFNKNVVYQKLVIIEWFSLVNIFNIWKKEPKFSATTGKGISEGTIGKGINEGRW